MDEGVVSILLVGLALMVSCFLWKALFPLVTLLSLMMRTDYLLGLLYLFGMLVWFCGCGAR